MNVMHDNTCKQVTCPLTTGGSGQGKINCIMVSRDIHCVGLAEKTQDNDILEKGESVQ